MGRKCCVYGCDGGYASAQIKVPVYRFPRNRTEKLKWVKPIPNLVNDIDLVSENMGICHAHWKKDDPMIYKGKHPSPTVPPSVFPEDIPLSCLTEPIVYRSTKNSTTDFRDRAMDLDESIDFNTLDLFSTSCVDMQNFASSLQAYLSIYNGSFGHDVALRQFFLFSKERRGSIHRWAIYFSIDSEEEHIHFLHYEMYRGIKKAHSALFKEKPLNRWSQLTELMRELTAVFKGNCPICVIYVTGIYKNGTMLPLDTIFLLKIIRSFKKNIFQKGSQIVQQRYKSEL